MGHKWAYLAGLGMVLGCGQATPGVTTLRGTVIDSATRQGIEGALVAVFQGTLADSITTNTVGNPNYKFGLRTQAGGSFALQVPSANYAVWAFAAGYHCQSAAISGSTQVALQPSLSVDHPPTVGDANFLPTRVIPTDDSKITANIAAGDPNDLLSHQVFVFEPLNNYVMQMTAPAVLGGANTWADGTWQAQVTAPNNQEILSYTVAAASSQCLTSFASATLTVAR